MAVTAEPRTEAPAAGVPAAPSLGEVVAVVGAWCDRFDAGVVSGAEAAAVVSSVSGLVRKLSGVRASAAVRAGECREIGGQASPARWLAREAGVGVGEARRVLDTARRLRDCPATAEAVAAGELSLVEAGEVTSAAVVAPGAEGALVAAAKASHDVGRLREQANRVRAAARSGEGDEARLARLRAGRRWREFVDADGATGIDARLAPQDYAAVSAVLDRFQRDVFRQARRSGRRDNPDAYRLDAFVAAMIAAGAATGLNVAAGRTRRQVRVGSPEHRNARRPIRPA